VNKSNWGNPLRIFLVISNLNQKQVISIAELRKNDAMFLAELIYDLYKEGHVSGMLGPGEKL
jgi:hypothetical protein